MLLCMRTTIDLPDDLAIAAKKMAAELRIPLRVLVEEGLRARLSQLKTPESSPQRKIDWVTVDGALPESLDLSDREQMYAWLRRAEP